MQVARYLEEFDLDDDIARILPVYRERRDAMVGELKADMPAGVNFTRPSGGLFLWVELPEDVSARDLLEECVRRNVAFVPGGAFFPNGGHENTLRLNFSNMPVERIREGVRRLASALEEVTRRKPMAGAVREEEPALVSQT
jgi:DNA-binding transcriptional MocR family regulator